MLDVSNKIKLKKKLMPFEADYQKVKGDYLVVYKNI